MKKIISLFLVAILGAGGLWGKTFYFEDKDNLPENIIICEDYYAKTGNIFLVLQDYMKSYCKLAEFDTNSGKIVETLFSYNENYIINGIHSDKNSFVVEVCYQNMDERDFFANIIYVDCETKAMYPVNKKPVSRAMGFYPSHPHIYKNEIFYLNHNFKDKLSEIHRVDIKTQEDTVIVAEPMIGEFPSIIFIEASEGLLVYDCREGSELKVKVYDIKNRKIAKTYEPLIGTSFHYNGALDVESKTMMLYGANSTFGDMDTIYLLNLENGATINYIGFDENTYLRHDELFYDGKLLLYAVQQDVSGKIIDHYYVEMLRVESGSSSYKKRTFCYTQGGKTKGFLLFDSEKNINKIEMVILN